MEFAWAWEQGLKLSGRCVWAVIKEHILMGPIILAPHSTLTNKDSSLLPGDFTNFSIKPPLLGADLVLAQWWDWREVGGVFCWCEQVRSMCKWKGMGSKGIKEWEMLGERGKEQWMMGATCQLGWRNGGVWWSLDKTEIGRQRTEGNRRIKRKGDKTQNSLPVDKIVRPSANLTNWSFLLFQILLK